MKSIIGNIFKFSILAGVSLLMASCASEPEPEPQIPPPKMRILSDELVRPDNLVISHDHINHLRTGEVVKEYVYNKYVDPNDPSIMYTNGSYYRVEDSSRWNLDPSIPHVTALGGVKSKTYPSEKKYFNLEDGSKLGVARQQMKVNEKKEELLTNREKVVIHKEAAIKKHLKATTNMAKTIKDQQLLLKEIGDENKMLKEQLMILLEEQKRNNRRR